MSPSSPSDPQRGRLRAADRQELITATGWRVVGRAAKLVSEPSPVAAAAALAPDDILYATRFHVRPRSGGGDAVGIVLSALGGALSVARPEGGAPLRRDGSECSVSDRFHAAEWETFEHGASWAGELTWIQPHPALPGVPCTTGVAVTERAGDVVVTVHVGAPGGLAAVRGTVGAGQARPSFLHELAHVARLGFDGWRAEPHVLRDGDVDDFVRSVLLSEIRNYPVAVLAPLEAESTTGSTEYVIAPAELAGELLGLAPLYYLERHQATYRLSDALGDRRLSCYWGALRVYMPDFSCADSGMQHPLLVRDRLEDPVMRAGLLGELGRSARLRIPVPEPVAVLKAEALRPAGPAASREVAAQAHLVAPDASAPAERNETAGNDAGSTAVKEGATAVPEDSAQAGRAFDDLAGELSSRLDQLIELNATLIDEVARLRTATIVRTANVSSVERRLTQFERMLREQFRVGPIEHELRDGAVTAERDSEDAEGDEPDLTLVDVVQHAESEHADALLVLESAVESAAGSPYEDAHRVASYLKAMAEIARRRQDGRLGMSLRDAFQEAGLDYRGHIASSTSARLRQQYVATLPDGRTVECHEHIVLGTSYDPKYCLRMYFTSRAPAEPRFVIAHVGRHFEIASTT